MRSDDRPTPSPADLSNWRTHPVNRWAFRHVRDILPVADVGHAPDQVRALPEAPQSLGTFALRLPDGSSLTLEQFLRATETDGMVILRDGRVVCEVYANDTTDRTPHILMSATKAVVGLLAGIVQRKGDLAIDALASDYVPEVADTAYRGATVRQLLDMRTGVVLDDDQLRAYDAASHWVPVAAGEVRPSLHEFFAHLTAPHHPHGGPFRYFSANTDLLGWVIERATGRAFADLLSTALWKPMGAAQDAYITVDRDGAPRCTGGLCATVRDFARIGQLVAQNGRRDATEVVPAAWIDDIAAGGDRAAWRDGEWGQTFAPISRQMSYRSGWYTIDDEPQTLFAMGVYGQNLFVDRTNGLVIAKVSSQRSAIDARALALTHRAVPEIRRCVLGAGP